MKTPADVLLLTSSLLGFQAFDPASAQVQEAWAVHADNPAGATAMAVDAAGHVYVTGWAVTVSNETDFATAKYDTNGNRLWLATYNGPGNSLDQPSAIAVDSGGYVYVTGLSYGAAGAPDFATVKYGPDGNQLWVARYDGPNQSGDAGDYPVALAVDSAGNVYVMGQSEEPIDVFPWLRSNIATVKYDSNGRALWVDRYTTADSWFDSPMGLKVDGAGNVHVAGSTLSDASDYDYVTVKYGPDGNRLWVARYNGPVNSYDFAEALGLDEAGNVYITGGSIDTSTGFDYATVKYDAQGNQLWVARYSSPGQESDGAWRLGVDGGGSVWVTGTSGGDSITVKYNAAGALLWAARLAGTPPDTVWDLAMDSQGNAYVTSLSSLASGVDYVTVKYDANGGQRWMARYHATPPSLNTPVRLAVDGAGNVFVTGSSTVQDSSRTVLVKYVQTPVAGFPEIQAGPQSQWVPVGSTVTLSVSATGAGPLYYQWRSNNVPLVNATSASLTLINVQLSATADYSVEVRNALGSIVSPAARLTVLAPPVMTSQPRSREAIVGSVVGFSGGAGGTLPIVYQWCFNGAPIPGATAGTLTLQDVQGTNTGDYTLVVTNMAGAATSQIARLTVQLNVRLAWQAEYASPGGGNDTAVGLGVDGAGNVYVTGQSVTDIPLDPPAHMDYATVKYSRDGVPMWTQRYDGLNHSDDMATALAVADDGEVFITGGSAKAPLQWGFATVKYDMTGSAQWTALYSGPGVASEHIARAIALDGEGDVYVTGGSAGEYATVKYGGNGQELWTARYSRGYSVASGIALDAMGNVYVTGLSDTVKYDPNGAQLWVLNGPGRALALNREGEVYLLSTHTLARYRPDGALLSTGSHGGTGTLLAVDAAGCAYVSGSSAGDYLTRKYDRDGRLLWTARYNGPADDLDVPTGLAVDDTGNSYVTGSSPGLGTALDFATVKYDANGNQLWAVRHDQYPQFSYDDSPVALKLDPEGHVVVTGSTGSQYTRDYLTLKYIETNVAGAPVILTAPGNQAGLVGTNATFSVTASGAPPLSYQWRFNGRMLHGATGPTLVVVNAQNANTGGYAVEVRNSIGLTLSAEANLTLYEPPRITRQPADRTVMEGFDQSFDVLATGTLPLGYQWRLNGAPLAGATNSTLLLTRVVTNQAGAYTVLVSNPYGSATSSVATLTVIAGDPVLDHWQVRYPPNDLSYLASVTYADGMFLAVGWSGSWPNVRGMVVTSADGLTWTSRSMDTTVSLKSIAHGNGTFVAVGSVYTGSNYIAAILTSTDGLIWTEQRVGTGYVLSGVAFGNGMFVAVGFASPQTGDIILTSPDGVTWTQRSSGTTNRLFDITYGDGRFVAVGERILSSTDGVAWTDRGATGSVSMTTGVAYGDGLFVVNGASVLTSSNGIDWLTRDAGVFSATALGNGTLVAISSSTSCHEDECYTSWRILTATNALASTNSFNWRTTTPPWPVRVHAAVYGAGVFVVLGGTTQIYTSPDGFDWTNRSPVRDVPLEGVTFGGGTFVAVGEAGTILTSANGTSWASRSPGSFDHLRGVAYGESGFVAVGDASRLGPVAGRILTSADTATWTAQTVQTNARLNAVAYGNGIYVAVGDSGTLYSTNSQGIILTSANGSSWMSGTSGGPDRLNGITYGNGTFLVAASAYTNGSYVATILSSVDGLSWVRRSLADSDMPVGVAYGNGLFVAMGSSGTAWTSADAVAWARRRPGTAWWMRGIAFGNGSFMAVGYLGAIFTSSDGVTWTRRPSGSSDDLAGVAYGNGSFVVVGGYDDPYSATLLQSGSLGPPDFITDVSVTEGNEGTTQALFTVNLATSYAEVVSVDFATADGSATAGSDYLGTNGTLIFNPGETSKIITVPVLGDILEPPGGDGWVQPDRLGAKHRAGDRGRRPVERHRARDQHQPLLPAPPGMIPPTRAAR